MVHSHRDDGNQCCKIYIDRNRESLYTTVTLFKTMRLLYRNILIENYAKAKGKTKHTLKYNH